MNKSTFIVFLVCAVGGGVALSTASRLIKQDPSPSWKVGSETVSEYIAATPQQGVVKKVHVLNFSGSDLEMLEVHTFDNQNRAIPAAPGQKIVVGDTIIFKYFVVQGRIVGQLAFKSTNSIPQ